MKNLIKKTVAVLCAATIAATVPAITAFANDWNVADADKNGKIEAADARIALRTSVGLEDVKTEKGKVICDVDESGTVTAADARLILRFAVGLEKDDNPGEDVPAVTCKEYDILRSGKFYMKGMMTDSEGTSPLEIGIDKDLIYMASEMDDIEIAMLLKGKKMYMIVHSKKAYLEMSETILKMFGMDTSDLVSSDEIDFSEYKDLTEADIVTDATFNSVACKKYTFIYEDGSILNVYVNGDKLLGYENAEANGIITAVATVEVITAELPEDVANPPKSYKRYSGVIGAGQFIGLLGDII